MCGHRAKILARTKKRGRTKNPPWIFAFPSFFFSCLPSRIIYPLPHPSAPQEWHETVIALKWTWVTQGSRPISVRGIINSRQRTVTKVRTRRLVSRSVSGRVDFPSPSSFLPPSFYSFFSLFAAHFSLSLFLTRILESIRAQ